LYGTDRIAGVGEKVRGATKQNENPTKQVRMGDGHLVVESYSTGAGMTEGKRKG